MANPPLNAALHNGPNTSQILVPFVAALPVVPTTHLALVLQADAQSLQAGMYFYQYGAWQFAMPLEAVLQATTSSDTVDIYINVTMGQTLPGNVTIYRDGQLQPGNAIDSGTAVWVAATQAVGPGELVPATTTRLGGVIVPEAGGLAVDVLGNLSISDMVWATINNKIGVVNSTGAGLSLVQSQSSGTLALKSIQNGQNISIVDDGNGTLIISSTGGISQVDLTGDVVGSGTGTVPTNLSPTGVVAGSYTKVTVDAKGRVLQGLNPTTLAGYGIIDALPLSGGSMTGIITMTGGTTVTGLADPVFPTDAVNKQTLDAAIAGAANGVQWRGAVDAATTGNITLSGLQVVDGVSLTAGMRCLVKDQTDPKQNGIYVVATGAWARAGDANTSNEIWKAATLVLGGTVNQLTQWTNTNSTAPIIGTDNITWGQLKGAANVYVAGAGLALNGLTFSIAPTGVTAGTWTKVTVNTLGQVVAASNLTPAELAAALGYTPVNRSGDTMQGALNMATPVSIGAGATTDLSATQANDVLITGSSVNITSFGSIPAGAHRKIIFGGSVTLKYNASSMILPSTSDIVTQVNDVASFVSLGGGNWQCEYYTRANGTALVGTSAPDPTKLPLAGGTMTGAINEANFVQITSGATTDLGAVNSNNVQVNAGTPITSFGIAAAGTRRAVVFNGAITLTHNAASLILPGGANISTAAGDIAEFVSIGSGNWRCEYYTKINGQSVIPTAAPDPTKLPLAGGVMTGAIQMARATVASSNILDAGAQNANYLDVTGTVSINSLGTSPSGVMRTLVFQGSLTLVYNATSLILPTAANIVTGVGDAAEFTSMGSGNWKCTNYFRNSGQPLAGGSGSDPTKLPLAGGTMTGSINMSATTSINYGAPTQAGRVNPFPAGAQSNTTIFSANYTPANGGPLTGFVGGTTGMTRKFIVATGMTVNMTNSATFILPTGADIVAVGGDTFEFLCVDGTTQKWQCINFMRGNGQAVAGGGSPFTTFQDFQGSNTVAAARFADVLERAEVSSGAPASSFYVANGAVKYYTGNPSGNWNVNITHSSSASLNTVMAVGDSVTVALLVTNGATPYMPGTITVDGAAVILKWQGGSAPAAGNASSVDVYSFTVIKVANASFHCFASQTQFK